MPGQRIYYVPPRLVGSVREWSGLDDVNGESWLVNHAVGLGFNAVWLSPFQETSAVMTEKHGQPMAKSLYAIRNHFALDPEFSATPNMADRSSYTTRQLAEIDALDRQHLRHFCQKANAAGLRVFADLVLNHVAADHPLVQQENADVAGIIGQFSGTGSITPVRSAIGQIIGMNYDSGKQYMFKFLREEKFSVCNIGGTPGYDTAQINFESPAAAECFLTGKNGEKGYYKQIVDWFIDNGFRDFRCDIAYRLPPEFWQEVISYARQREPGSIFVAETLGAPEDKLKDLAKAVVTDENGDKRKGFDLGMLSLYWWNMTDPWLPEGENPLIQGMSKYGGAGSPDNHDTDGTVAGNLKKHFNADAATDKAVAEVCLRNYALSVLACNSSYMQMGYEYCNEKQNDVFLGSSRPEDWHKLRKERAGKGHALDISGQIKAINNLKQNLHVENCKVIFSDCAGKQGGHLVKIHCEYIDIDTNKKKADIILVMNKKPEKGPVHLTDKYRHALNSSGLEKLHIDGAAAYPANSIGSVLVYHTPLKDITGNSQKHAFAKKPQLPPPIGG